MSEWRSIDSAPRDGNCILLGSPADAEMDWPGIVDNCYWDADFCGHGAWVLMSEGPTVARAQHLYSHWMPLPDPPAAVTAPDAELGVGKEKS